MAWACCGEFAAIESGRAAAKGLQPRAAARHMVTTKPERISIFPLFIFLRDNRDDNL